MVVEVMPWDRGILATAAGIDDPRTNPRVLGAVLVDLAVRGHLVITAESHYTYLVRPTADARLEELRPDEVVVRGLVEAAAAAAPSADGVSVFDLRRDPDFARAWHLLLGRLATTEPPARGARRPAAAADDGADGYGVAFGLRIVVGLGAIAAAGVGWPNPVAVVGGLLGLAGTVLVPDARPQVVRGRSASADLEEVDRSVLTLAASGTSRIDRAAYERALPFGVLAGRNLDLWAVLADGTYPDGCPWFTLGPELTSPGSTTPVSDQPSAAGSSAQPGPAGPAGTAPAADPDVAPTPAPAPAPAADTRKDARRADVRMPGVAALLRQFCLQAAENLLTADDAAPARP